MAVPWDTCWKIRCRQVDTDRAERDGEMRNLEKKEHMLSINEIMEHIKRKTDYDKEGLVAMLPFLRANNDGIHRLVIPLLEKVVLREGEKASHIIIRKVLYSDIVRGEVIAEEEAVKFFMQYAPGDSLVKPVPMFRNGIDKSLAEEYRNRQYGLIEKIRQEICESGECLQDTYMEYLRYALYLASDELAAKLLYLSRTFSTDTSMVLECGECHKKVTRDVQGYQEGQLVLMDCPYCQRPIHAIYHICGRCIMYNDRYMRQERSRYLEKPVAVMRDVTEKESIFETDSAFSVCKPLQEEDLFQQKKRGVAALETGQPISACRDDEDGKEQESNPADGQILGCEGQERLAAEEEMASDAHHSQKSEDVEEGPDAVCQEAKVIGLAPIKRFFSVIRAITFFDGAGSPTPVFALLGDKGCGINTTIRYLSGYQEKEIMYTDLSSIHEECFYANYRCIVVSLGVENRVPAWMPAALSRLKRHTTVFLVGVRDAKLPEELSVHVVYRISYKPYTIDELNNLFTFRLASYGLHIKLTREQQTQLFRNKNALDIKRLCQQIYFKYRVALCDGKGSGDVLLEEVIAREIRGAIGNGEQRVENG